MDYVFLSKTILFRGISAEEIESMMGCLRGVTKTFSRGTTIHHAGENINTLGLILSGSVCVENDALLLEKFGEKKARCKGIRRYRYDCNTVPAL